MSRALRGKPDVQYEKWPVEKCGLKNLYCLVCLLQKHIGNSDTAKKLKHQFMYRLKMHRKVEKGSCSFKLFLLNSSINPYNLNKFFLMIQFVKKKKKIADQDAE